MILLKNNAGALLKNSLVINHIEDVIILIPISVNRASYTFVPNGT